MENAKRAMKGKFFVFVSKARIYHKFTLNSFPSSNTPPTKQSRTEKFIFTIVLNLITLECVCVCVFIPRNNSLNSAML